MALWLQSQSHSGLRLPSNKKTIYDRNLNRSRNAELSRSSFAYLFMEMVSYAQKRVTGIQDLEKRCDNPWTPAYVQYSCAPLGSTNKATLSV